MGWELLLGPLISTGVGLLGNALFGGGGGDNKVKMPSAKENFETNQIQVPSVMSGGGIAPPPDIGGGSAWRDAISRYMGR